MHVCLGCITSILLVISDRSESRGQEKDEAQVCVVPRSPDKIFRWRERKEEVKEDYRLWGGLYRLVSPEIEKGETRQGNTEGIR